ncbi:MAG: hypothetical protein Q4G34_07965 [Micrococcus sp.]|nr:hypothetical protein [Micrococcus sp.]
MTSRDDDARAHSPGEHEQSWTEIVARLRAEDEDGVWAPESAALPDDPTPTPAAPEPTAPTSSGVAQDPLDGPLPGDFVAPTPPPLLSGAPGTVVAVGALVVPVLVLLAAAVVGLRLPSVVSIGLVVCAVGGALAVFFQLPRRGEGRGDRLDRGAQV